MCVCAFIAYFQPQQRRAIFQFYLISRLISNNGTARHPQWTNAGMAATENIVAPFVKHCRRNYRCNLHAPLNWSLLSPARWFIPPSSFRSTLLSFSSHLPPHLLFFSSFFIFQLSRRNENACISSFRNRGSVTRSVLKRIFRKSETKRRRGKCRYFCDIAKGVWRTMAIFRNGLLEKEKKKGRRGEWTGVD